MPEIFSALPGIEVPVQDISTALSRMWSDNAGQGRAAPEKNEVLAMQVNLVLHFGFNAMPEDAVAQFRTAVRFASRYPSRVVVLCPMLKDRGGKPEIRAKIYGECFLGKSKGDSRCCEFVLLNYSFEARRYLESQVSICLISDLPLYYWAHRFTASERLADYRALLTKARRFIIDTASAPEDVLGYAWPKPENMRDLARSRMLPVRQSIGQFLARYPKERISEGLVRVELGFEEVHRAEGRALGRWLRENLTNCGAGDSTDHVEKVLPHGAGTCFSLHFDYGDSRHFDWSGNCDTGIAQFDADLGQGRLKMSSHISLYSPEQALAEAIFF
jgi:hypothetical protein